VQGSVEAVLVGRRYEVLDTLYEGSSAQILRVRDRVRPGRTLVLKWVPGRSSASDRALRLEDEFRLLGDFRHPALVRPTDFGYDIPRDRTYLVMEEAPGVALDRLQDRDEETLTRITVDVLRALSALHARSVLHLDLKPSNVLWDAATGRTTVLDLDLAAYPEGAAGRGTAPYASPEVMGAGGEPGAWSDLFSLGVTLHEVLTGVRPDPDGAVRDLDPGDAHNWAYWDRRIQTVLDRLPLSTR